MRAPHHLVGQGTQGLHIVLGQARLVQGRTGLHQQVLGQRLGCGQAQQGHIGGLVVGGIFAWGFAQRGGVGQVDSQRLLGRRVVAAVPLGRAGAGQQRVRARGQLQVNAQAATTPSTSSTT